MCLTCRACTMCAASPCPRCQNLMPSGTCPDGHRAQHVAVVIPLVPGRPFRIVHHCPESHHMTGPLDWTEDAADEGAVADKVRIALDVLHKEVWRRG